MGVWWDRKRPNKPSTAYSTSRYYGGRNLSVRVENLGRGLSVPSRGRRVDDLHIWPKHRITELPYRWKKRRKLRSRWVGSNSICQVYTKAWLSLFCTGL